MISINTPKGTKIICISLCPPDIMYKNHWKSLIIGQEYTVRNIKFFSEENENYGIYLEEILNKNHPTNHIELAYSLSFFRRRDLPLSLTSLLISKDKKIEA
jgi:hypothetical protein